jgi:hypothetical protein
MITLLAVLAPLALLVLLFVLRRRQMRAEQPADVAAIDAENAAIYLRALIASHPVALERLNDFNVGAFVCAEARQGNPLALQALKVRAVARSIKRRPKLKAMLRGVALAALTMLAGCLSDYVPPGREACERAGGLLIESGRYSSVCIRREALIDERRVGR